MEWSSLVIEPVRLLIYEMVMFIPRMFGAVVILVIGWMLARVFRTVMVRVLRTLRVDKLSEKARLSDVLRRGAVKLTFVELLGQLGYWLMMVATIIVALQFVGVTVASEWLERFGLFLPRLLISIVILLFGMLLASFLGTTVRAASLNAGFPQGYMLGQVVFTTIVLFTIIVALEQLQVVTRPIEVALYILLGACGLAFALAVGLGSQEFVKRYLADLMARWKT